MSAHEMRMCLEEASLECSSLNVPRAVAPWVVNVMVTHYCAATDAIAGSYCGESKGFDSEKEALEWINKNYNPADDRLHYEVKGPPPPPMPKEIFEEEVPF